MHAKAIHSSPSTKTIPATALGARTRNINTIMLSLAPELRAEIWHHAIAAYVQDLIDSLPPRFHEYDADTQGYEDLVDCFPILAACREARKLAIRYFQRPRTSDGERPLRYRYIPTWLRRSRRSRKDPVPS
ncbi:hypothetical protein GGTG_12267 [Gaeumannomyces tritici R3-111a-1]|uniref:2EXR domain-containing protein n=1 Tax=Gaeumannomyces tritici (strain R3-111a-1) TaxID=644352 RepID=J3PFJ2_GAET3|nr:hypothetical protein GGTG_12267 [Gaeumannomyces tritici R3-111a-1]EJT70094.1 hypothetical protein GGTG_12267 [Gaeumannomyces tritici R3-111a-1]